MSLNEIRKQLDKTPNERIEDIFSMALRESADKPGSQLNLEEFDVDVKKELGKKTTVEVTVFGVAGSTTQDEFCSKNKAGKIDYIANGGKSVKVALDNGLFATFNLVDCRSLNSNSYLVVYENA